MVAWSEGVTYQVRKVGNWKSTFLSGEGLVVDLTGPGVIYTQSRSPGGLPQLADPRSCPSPVTEDRDWGG